MAPESRPENTNSTFALDMGVARKSRETLDETDHSLLCGLRARPMQTLGDGTLYSGYSKSSSSQKVGLQRSRQVKTINPLKSFCVVISCCFLVGSTTCTWFLNVKMVFYFSRTVKIQGLLAFINSERNASGVIFRGLSVYTENTEP